MLPGPSARRALSFMAASSEIPNPASESGLSALDRRLESIRALGVFGLLFPVMAGASLAAGLRTLQIDAAHGAANVTRASWVPYVVLSIFAALVLVGASWLRRRRGDGRTLGALYVDGCCRASFVLLLPLIICVREPIENPKGWVVLALTGLAATVSSYAAYQWSKDKVGADRSRLRFVAGVLVALLIALYASLVIWIAFTNHRAFNTGRSDLGYYLSVFRKSSQGVPLGCSLCGSGTHLTGHFDPILVPLSAFFLIHPFAETLLVIQAIWLALGAWPVYLLAKEQVRHRGAAVAFVVAYLSYPALHGVNFFDFHSIALCIPPLLWFLLFIEQKRIRLALLSLAVCLVVREDVAVAASCIGLSCVFSGDREKIRLGWVTIVVSAAYFLFVKVVFMHHADPLNVGSSGKGGYALFYEELIPPGRSTGGLLGTLLGDPVFSLAHILTEPKIDYILLLLLPLLGLPLLARGRVQLVYGAAVTLLATAHLYSVHAQYSSTLISPMFGLALSGLARIRTAPKLPFALSGPRLSRALSLGVLTSSLLCSWKFGGIVPNNTFIAGFRPLSRSVDAASRADDAWLRHFALSLPRGAAVAANSRILPHLGPVSNIYMIEQRRQADYVIANLKNAVVARSIQLDVDKKYLKEIDARGSYHIYKTNYPKSERGRVEGGEDDDANPAGMPGGS